jgi:hypothetical protein
LTEKQGCIFADVPNDSKNNTRTQHDRTHFSDGKKRGLQKSTTHHALLLLRQQIHTRNDDDQLQMRHVLDTTTIRQNLQRRTKCLTVFITAKNTSII